MERKSCQVTSGLEMGAGPRAWIDTLWGRHLASEKIKKIKNAIIHFHVLVFQKRNLIFFFNSNFFFHIHFIFVWKITNA